MIGRQELYNILKELSLNMIKILVYNKIRPSGYTRVAAYSKVYNYNYLIIIIYSWWNFSSRAA